MKQNLTLSTNYHDLPYVLVIEMYINFALFIELYNILYVYHSCKDCKNIKSHNSKDNIVNKSNVLYFKKVNSHCS